MNQEQEDTSQSTNLYYVGRCHFCRKMILSNEIWEYVEKWKKLLHLECKKELQKELDNLFKE